MTELVTSQQPAVVKGELYSDALMWLAVSWELFRSDWYVACINRESSAIRKKIESEVNNVLAGSRSILAKGAFKVNWIQVRVPSHPTLDQVYKALDPNGRNAELPRDIGEDNGLIASPYKERIEDIGEPDKSVVNALVSIRNVIAHRSRSSIKSMNARLRDLDPKVDPGLCVNKESRLITINGIGRYARAVTDNGNGASKARCLHFFDRIASIAKILHVNTSGG